MAVLLILASVYVLTGSVSNGQLINMTDDDHDSQNQTGSYANLYYLKKTMVASILSFTLHSALEGACIKNIISLSARPMAFFLFSIHFCLHIELVIKHTFRVCCPCAHAMSMHGRA